MIPLWTVPSVLCLVCLYVGWHEEFGKWTRGTKLRYKLMRRAGRTRRSALLVGSTLAWRNRKAKVQ